MDLLKGHVKRMHRGKKESFSCDLCDKTYTLKENLGRHKRYVHSSIPKSWTCDICGVTFKDPSGLQRHNASKHVENERVKCDLCGKSLGCKLAKLL